MKLLRLKITDPAGFRILDADQPDDGEAQG